MKAPFIALIATAACVSPTTTEHATHDVRIQLSRASIAAPPQPYVSIVDSIVLTVTPEGKTPRVLGAHLGRRDTTAAFTMKVPDGSVQFDVTVLSNYRLPLYTGSATVTVDRDVPVDIVPTPVAAVMAVSPDSVTIPLQGTRQATFVVYNRGIGGRMTFQVDTSGAHTQCAPNHCFAPRILTGVVAPGSSFSVVVDSIRRFTNPIPLSFQTKEGSVTVVITTQ